MSNRIKPCYTLTCFDFPFRTGEPPQYVPFETISFGDMVRNLTQIGNEDPNDWMQFSSKKKKPQRTFSIMQ